jgi:hypothetical protein
MSWLFSQALVEEYLGDTSLDGELSVPLNGNNTQQAYCAPDKMTKFSRLSRFGMTYKPLTESRGEDLLTLYLADFHAKTSVQRGGAGITGERSSMWKHMARIISEVRPQYAFVENSPMLTTRGLGTVLADLAQMGFDAEWGVLSAADIGANHLRERMWIVAKNTNTRCKHGKKGNTRKLATSKTQRTASAIPNKPIFAGLDKNNWKTEPDMVRMVNGVADAVDRLKAIGNGQVPLCAATAWKLLSERLEK